MSIRSIILVFFLFLSVVCPLAAQHRDTVYVERETVTYDTVTVYDTVRVHDTLNIADYLRSEEFESRHPEHRRLPPQRRVRAALLQFGIC